MSFNLRRSATRSGVLKTKKLDVVHQLGLLRPLRGTGEEGIASSPEKQNEMDAATKLDADIRGTMMFRLMFGTQDDHYEGEAAAALLRGLRGLDDESARVTIKLWAMDAEDRQCMN